MRFPRVPSIFGAGPLYRSFESNLESLLLYIACSARYFSALSTIIYSRLDIYIYIYFLPWFFSSLFFFSFFFFCVFLRCCILHRCCARAPHSWQRTKRKSFRNALKRANERSGNGGGPIGHATEPALADRLPAVHHESRVALLVHFRGGLLRARRNGRRPCRARRPSPPAIR